MIRALFFDLDGTLLSSEKTLLPSTVSALSACRALGVRVFFATARSPGLDRMFQWGSREFSLFDGGIYCNGAYMHIGNQIMRELIDPDVVRRCIQAVAGYAHVHIALHTQDDRFALNHVLPDSMLGAWGVTRERTMRIIKDSPPPSIKILIYTGCLVDAAEPLPQALYAQLKSSASGLANIYLTDQGRTIQIVSRKVSKLTAIDRIRRQLGLRRDEIAVFGDDINDLEMLSGFPCSVAMGNGAPQAIHAAAFVTRTNDDDGVSFALHNLLHIL